MGSNSITPYWHVNVPESRRTPDCPDFLLGLNAKDIAIISTPDVDYHRQTWDEVRLIAFQNQLQLFQRVPSELRRYKAFTYKLVQRHGSVANFILSQRLGWETPIKPRGGPFEHPDDVKVLYNDWPYGIDEKIVHLVVWTKFSLDDDPLTGDLTDQARRQIDSFVSETFLQDVAPDQLIWFKNWANLKSVNAVEHFHVMVYDPDPDFVARVTTGDVPQCAKPDT